MLAQTFQGVANEWLDLQRKSLAAETISILGARLRSGLYPYLGNRPIAAITAQEVLIALKRIEARGRLRRHIVSVPSLGGCFATR